MVIVSSKKQRRYVKEAGVNSFRFYFVYIIFIILWLVLIFRLFTIQVLNHSVYTAKAERQYNVLSYIPANRGEIFWSDISTNSYLPLVINRPLYNLYIVPKNIKSPYETSSILNKALDIDEDIILSKVLKDGDPYEKILSGLTDKDKDSIINKFNDLNLDKKVYGFENVLNRFYVEGSLSSHITGFLGFGSDGVSRIGQYGIEEYFEKELAGKMGLVFSERDARGVPIAIGDRVVKYAEDGSDIILTIDKNIQYKACSILEKYTKRFNAQEGDVIIMDPITGKLLALCVYPSFDPNKYGEENSLRFINDAVSRSYEPGSIFKPITMASALDIGAITPWTTYFDKGYVTIDKYTIENADGKSHGISTMIDVLDQSLNTGAIFAMRKAGMENFRKYVEKFGFGRLTGIELAGEVDGDISTLYKRSEIYFATASFGQGITVTPIHLVVAYATIARGGVLVKPTIVESIKGKEGYNFSVSEIDRVIDVDTAKTLSAMLVSSVKNGYAKRAGVPGFNIAGKTGTAQIPKKEGLGYSDDTIHSFVGFGPVSDNRNPVFVMLVKLDRPTDVRFASDSAAPLFGEIAKFLLSYLEVPPDDSDL